MCLTRVEEIDRVYVHVMPTSVCILHQSLWHKGHLCVSAVYIQLSVESYGDNRIILSCHLFSFGAVYYIAVVSNNDSGKSDYPYVSLKYIWFPFGI